MNYYLINGELYHHGVKGQKWGIRRYQNPDGSLTDAGRKRNLKTVKKMANEFTTIKRMKHLAKNDMILSANRKLHSLRERSQSDLEALENRRWEMLHDPKVMSKIDAEVRKNMRKIHLEEDGYDDPDGDYFHPDYDDVRANAMYKDKQYASLAKVSSESWKAYEAAAKQEADRLLGEYGDRNISSVLEGTRKARNYLAQYL